MTVKSEALRPEDDYKNSLISRTRLYIDINQLILRHYIHSLVSETMRLLSLVTVAACISQVLSAYSSIEVRKEWRDFKSDEQAVDHCRQGESSWQSRLKTLTFF